MKELTVEDQIYLCKYHDIDTSIYRNLGLKEGEVKELIKKYKENGLYEQYRNLSDEEYEKIIKKENAEKRKYITNRKEREILDQYNFDKNKDTYNYYIELLSEAERTKQHNEEFIAAKVYERIAKLKNTNRVNIQNECQRYLNNTFSNNEKLFLQKYKQKPTIMQFIMKEIEIIENIESKNNKSVQEIEQKDNSDENIITKNNVLSEKMIVQVPISIIMEYYYQRGYIDALKEKWKW